MAKKEAPINYGLLAAHYVYYIKGRDFGKSLNLANDIPTLQGHKYS